MHVDEGLQAAIARELLIPPSHSRLLLTRGIATVEEAIRFLEPSFDQLYDPFLFSEMRQAVDLIRKSVGAHRRILVHGDYDADGVCGTALLFQVLASLGADVHYFIPDRARDGYGLAKRVMERGVGVGLGLVISVDCGSSDGEVIGYLRENGIDIIVTDHHETRDRIEGASAFINPKLPGERYPFKELAGVGVAFKLLQGLERSMGVDLSLCDALDLVAVGTLGDYVPLTGENRVLTRLGMERLGRWRRPGLASLRVESGLPKEGFSARQICYTLVPRLNSPGRISSARGVVELLVTRDSEEAASIARDIEEQNRRRRSHDSLVTEEACYLADIVLKRSEPSSFVFTSSSWHEGVVGIGAARLAERYNVPSVLIAVRDGLGKGSARSAGSVNIKEALEHCADVLLDYGGHREAGGFSIREEDIPDFQRLFESAVEELSRDGIEPDSTPFDAEISLGACNLDTIGFINRLAPFGPGNHEPVFLVRGIGVMPGSRIVGDGHLKIVTADGEGRVHDMIGFSLGRSWPPAEIIGTEIDALVHLRRNSYGGRVRPQIQIDGIRQSEKDVRV